MPGVPTGRGCDGCRRQKKKCDQKLPACTRCTRLKIPCIGAGQQRFKFVSGFSDAATLNTSIPLQATNSGSGSGSRSNSCPDASPRALTSKLPSEVASEPALLIARRFASALGIDDVRYSLHIYGAFLRYIPQHIGRNAALDAAADSFATAFSNLCAKHVEYEAYHKHGIALRELRGVLGHGPRLNDDEAGQVLCAIYLTMVSEDLLLGHHPTAHAEGMAYLLQLTSERAWESQFETEMIIVMMVSVLIESIGNPRVKVNPWLPELLNRIEKKNPEMSGAHYFFDKKTGKFPDAHVFLTLRGMLMLSDYMCQPTRHYDELAAAHEALQGSRKTIFAKLSTCPSLPHGPERYIRDIVRTRLEVTLALVISLSLVINRILQAFPWHDLSIYNMREILIQDALEAGDRALYARPLGASHAPAMVSIAFSMARDMGSRSRAGTLLRELCVDFPRLNPLAEAQFWYHKFMAMHSQILAALGIATPPSDIPGGG